MKMTPKTKTTTEVSKNIKRTTKMMTSKIKTTSKMKTTSKIGPPLQNIFCPPPLKKIPEFFLMTSPHDSHTTTNVKPEMIPGV